MTDKPTTPPEPDELDWSEHVNIPVWISGTGRAVALVVPPDLSPLEVLELVSFLTLRNEAGLGATLARMAARPRLVVASGLEALELGVGRPTRRT